MNLKLTLPTPDTHPNFPLWKQGYSPEQVYDAFFPKGFRFLCNPQRPSVCGRFGLLDDRLWRFEYVVQPGEDGTEMASQQNIRKIVYPYLRHPGHRYGCVFDNRLRSSLSQVLTDSTSGLPRTSHFRKTASKSSDQGHSSSQPEAVIAGQKAVSSYAVTPHMSSRPVSLRYHISTRISLTSCSRRTRHCIWLQRRYGSSMETASSGPKVSSIP